MTSTFNKIFIRPMLLMGAVVLTAVNVFAQSSQTIRGQLTDEVTKGPLPGVSIRIEGTSLGSVTDENGNFRIAQVPVGRQTLLITYIGYETQTLPNILVTAGKEVILNVSLTESVQQLDELTVVADSYADKTSANNELAIVSARSFNTDETKRYAGALGDPSRMAANLLVLWAEMIPEMISSFVEIHPWECCGNSRASTSQIPITSARS